MNDLNDSPCWEDAYLRQRMYEAQETGRCKCDFNKNKCDNCGSTISAALSVLQDPSLGFVSRNKKLKYFISEQTAKTDTLIISVNHLKQALEKGPVICNMYIRKSQARFLDKPSNDSYMYGNDRIKKYGNDGVYDSAFEFPATNMDEPREKFGHCVVIVGFKDEGEHEKRTKFRVRNSFGRFWGHFGDFYLTDQHIHPETVHQLLFIPPECIQLKFF